MIRSVPRFRRPEAWFWKIFKCGTMANSVKNRCVAFKTFAFLILVCTSDLCAGQIRYSIPEELEVGGFVGNIVQDLGMNVPQLYARKFRLTSEGAGHYMKVNLNDGILLIRERIDREQVCGQTYGCTIPFEIILENPLASQRGEVEVLDINDNSPSFRNSSISLQIAETIAPGVRFRLVSAEDPDIGINTIAAYTISSNEHFSLKTQRTDDGVIIAELLLEKPLGRELQSSFRLALTATDGGIPQRSGTAQILITVVDINDNPPVFDHDIYRGSVKENTPQGMLVMKVNAIDLDEGPNAELAYYFSQLSSARVKELFTLDPHTGEIRTKVGLDFEETSSYSLDIEAVDHGVPAIAGHSKFFIDVIDVNDNAPEIKVTSTKRKIQENGPPGTLITLINVVDRDSGENGRFHCEIPKNIPFRLRTSSKNHYELITSESLDRESVSEYNIHFLAWDMGSPSLSTNKTIQISISDVNDNAPRFGESSYNVYVMENNAPGTSIFAVTASDADQAQNSYVSYSFKENLRQDFPASRYLSINSINGTIYAQRSFDYEKLKSFQIHVQARDAGVPPLINSATVTVIILDQNDNSPVIVSPISQMGSAAVLMLPQTASQGYLITKIIAADADSGQNARLSYQVQRSTDPSLFNVGRTSGEIRTARPILESGTTTHSLVILVKDNGQPSLSSTVSIHITAVENITDIITESSNFVAKPEYFSDANLYLIVIFGCTSVFFLVVIILLIGIMCKHDRNTVEEYNSSIYCSRPGDSRDAFPCRRAMEETLRYPGTGRVLSVPEPHQYSVCLSPESAKSDFLFLKPYGVSTSQARC
ncbi:protocadherin gamma-C5-like [Amblyraja radiata]|uniref:protocadherin gamma-C5-like n=1 Tax=Amblyraja radiata TaxID=386614 RepID=UPI00140248F5|nr:protocadherin gamma-C5-like [Amblyraja radiata]